MYYAKNPILPGFCPDPSICRVGEDFYIVNSTFSYFPGVPVFHSKDLAHWELIGNVLNRASQLPLERGGHSEGIFAPTLRYHDGTFYMITTNMTAGGTFIVTAENIRGPWSEPHYLGKAAEGIDPSIFFDEDGVCYYVGTRPNQKGVRYNGDWEIWLQELDIDKMQLVGESKKIWKGAVHHAIWPEGPHIYKKDGYYYVLHAEGGTGLEHAISVARSKSIWGPYEGCPKNPIFTHRHLGEDYPVVAAGHGDLVEAADGNWYIVMLATRRWDGYGNTGRDTFLAKVTWKDDWPVINAGIGKLEESVLLPGEPVYLAPPKESWHFFDDSLPPDFVWLRNPKKPFFSLKEKEGALCMYAGKDTLVGRGSPTYLGVRQKGYHWCAETVFSLYNTEKVEAGLAIVSNEDTHIRLVKDVEYEAEIKLICCKSGKEKVLAQDYLTNGQVELRMNAHGHKLDCSYRDKRGTWKLLYKDLDMRFLSTEETGGFTGCTIGMYAAAKDRETEAFADFYYFSCRDTLA